MKLQVKESDGHVEKTTGSGGTGSILSNEYVSSALIDQEKVAYYRNIVFYITFIAYAMSHFSRKSYTNVKVELRENGMDPILLSQMDTMFMFFYAIGSFFSGQLGDIYHAPTVVGFGLIGSGICVFLLVAGVFGDLTEESTNFTVRCYFLGTWLLHGLTQSTGGPCGTSIMGNWFGAKNRGWIFGTWTCHQYIGNIIAACVATAILNSSYSWEWALILPAVCNIVWGFVCIRWLPEQPGDVGVETEETIEKKLIASAQLHFLTMEPISFTQALKIPNVIGYALAFGFFKLINYALFFWLPFFLAQCNYTPQQSNMISILYDVGMMPGGIIVGTVSDFLGGRRACVIAIAMTILVPLIHIFSEFTTQLSNVVLLMILGFMGVLVGGPNNIITSAVAADLADHPTIRGNNKALGTVTGIINGSGSLTAALGLLLIGPMQVAYGWGSVWNFLIFCAIVGTLLMSPKVYKELYPTAEKENEDESISLIEVGKSKGNGYQSVSKEEK